MTSSLLTEHLASPEENSVSPSIPLDASSLTGKLTALQTLTERLICMSDTGQAYQQMVEAARKLIGCDHCALFTIQARQQRLVRQASAGNVGSSAASVCLGDEQSIHCQAFLEEYLVHVPDLQDNQGFQGHNPDLRSEVIQEESGQRFDPHLVEVLTDLAPKFSEINLAHPD